MGGVMPEESRALEYSASLLVALAGISSGVRVVDSPGPVMIFQDRVLADAERLRSVFEISTLQRENHTNSRDREGRFREDGISWNVLDAPVSRAAMEIRSIIRSMVPESGLNPMEPAVIFTHDIDRIHFRDIYSLVKVPLRHVREGRPWVSWPTAMDSGSLLNVYKKILDLEAGFGIHSWCFFMGSDRGRLLRQARYSPETPALSPWLKLAGTHCATIGLHGSYAAPETNSYSEEKARLQAACGQSVTTHRNHYLRMNSTSFWSQLQFAGFALDSTVGYVNTPGFRAGICQLYRPWDPVSCSMAKLWELPLVYMDRHHHLDNPDRILAILDAMMDMVMDCGGQVAILTHPESFAVDNRWFDMYRQMIRVVQSKKISTAGRLPVLEIMR